MTPKRQTPHLRRIWKPPASAGLACAGSVFSKRMRQDLGELDSFEILRFTRVGQSFGRHVVPLCQISIGTSFAPRVIWMRAWMRGCNVVLMFRLHLMHSPTGPNGSMATGVRALG